MAKLINALRKMGEVKETATISITWKVQKTRRRNPNIRGVWFGKGCSIIDTAFAEEPRDG